MVFIDNKYTRWYYNIINRAQLRSNTGYVERHHIIPQSLGGNNTKSNLVKLTAREHFVCHLLLPKMTSGNNQEKMWYAAFAMSRQCNTEQSRYLPSSKIYEILKIKNSIIVSRRFNGRKASKEERKKRSQRMTGTGNHMWGKKHSPDTIEKIRQARAMQDNSHLKGRVITEEWREKIRQTLLNGGSTKGQPKPKKQCEICGKFFAPHIVSRWHGSKCKG